MRTGVQGSTRRAVAHALWPLARRGFWAAMLALHVLALPSLVDSAGSADALAQLSLVPRIAGLTLSAIFFVLKVFDVSWLQMRSSRHAWVAAILIIGLLHVGVIDRAINGQPGVDPDHMPWLIAGVMFGSALFLRQILVDLAACLGSALLGGFRPRPYSLAAKRGWRPHEFFSHALFAALRAPPVA